MALTLYQTRYDFIDDKKHGEYEEGYCAYIKNILVSNLITNGLLMSNKDSSIQYIKKISIQTIPGIKFCVNESGDWIKIGSTGMYEISMFNIFSLKFEYDSVDNLIKSPNASLLIDFYYE